MVRHLPQLLISHQLGATKKTDNKFWDGVRRFEQGIRNEREIEIAKEMKFNGESIEKIIKYTGLSSDEINLL